MIDDIQKKDITIQDISQKLTANGGVRVQITDTNNNKYSFFTKKRDGTETKANATYIQLQVTVGSEVKIGFKEEEGEYEGKKFIRRKILFFAATDEQVNI